MQLIDENVNNPHRIGIGNVVAKYRGE